jgi:hypothetical protein
MFSIPSKRCTAKHVREHPHPHRFGPVSEGWRWCDLKPSEAGPRHVPGETMPCMSCSDVHKFHNTFKMFFLIVFLISIKTSNVSIIFQTHLTIVCPTMFISKDIFMAFSNVFHICSYGSWIFSTCFPYVPGLRCWVQPRTGPPLGSINSCGTVKHGMACWKMPRL